MANQSSRQAARRAALEAQAKRRRERADRDKRLEQLALDVMVALRERDESVARCEQRAGRALRAMVQDERVSMRDAVAWCADELTVREVSRLVHLVEEVGGTLPQPDAASRDTRGDAS